jgi:hypothetical protein
LRGVRRGLVDDEVDALVGAVRHDLVGDQDPRRGLALEQAERPSVLGGEGLGEAAQLGQMTAKPEELVDGLVEGIAHQIADHVLHQGPVADLGRPGRPAGGRGGPSLTQQHPGLVPVQVGPVIPVGGVVRQGEEPHLDPVHRAVAPVSWAMASSCSR